MTAPCKDCTERKVGCHGNCQKYHEFSAECEKRRTERNMDCLTRISPRVIQAKAAKLKRQKQGRQ